MNILVAIDGSASSQTAIEAVLHQTWPDRTELRLLSVLTGLESIWPFFDRHAHMHQPEDGDLEIGEAHSRTEEHLALVEAEISALRPGITVSAEVRRGEIAEEIVNAAVDWQADLIVVGSHGRKGLSRMILGSVSQTVLLTSPIPVIIVKKSQPLGDDGFTRIVVALDGSKHSEGALRWIAAQSWSKQAHFHLLHVYSKDSIEYQDAETNRLSLVGQGAERGSSLHALQARAAGLSEVLGLGHEQFSCEIIGGDPADSIVKVSERLKTDLLLMGSHGWQGMTRLMIGSVSQRVAEQVHCSVGIVPVHEAEDAPHEQVEQTIEIPEERNYRDTAERPHVLPGGMI